MKAPISWSRTLPWSPASDFSLAWRRFGLISAAAVAELEASGTPTSGVSRAGGAAVANTDGDISSNVSVNNDLGFSIVEYTATGVSATVGHGLDVPPELIIAKVTNQSYGWIVYAAPLGAGKYLTLNSNGQANTASDFMDNTNPTASVFTAGTNNLNYQNGNENIA